MLYNDWKGFYEPPKPEDFKNEARKAFEDRYLAPEALTLGSFDPGSWDALPESPKPLTMSEGVELNILRAQAAAKDEHIANLIKWYTDSQTTVVNFGLKIAELRGEIAELKRSKSENPKPAAGEALANAFRADSFSSPYGR